MKKGFITIEIIIIGSIVILAGVLLIRSLDIRTKESVHTARDFVDKNIAAHQAELAKRPQ